MSELEDVNTARTGTSKATLAVSNNVPTSINMKSPLSAFLSLGLSKAQRSRTAGWSTFVASTSNILPLHHFVAASGFEPVTFRLSAGCSHQLSYAAVTTSPLWESNPPPLPYHGSALPNELRGRKSWTRPNQHS